MAIRLARLATIFGALAALATAANAQTMQQLSTDITTLVRDAVPSVVSIKADRAFLGVWQQTSKGKAFTMRAAGTGFVIEDGYILTSDTVVSNATEIEVTFPDGTVIPGKLAGTDPMTNTALVKMDKPKGKPLVLGDSSTVKPGALVVSVNNRNGASNLVTLGIVSATDARMAGLPTSVLQISGDVGPGASGGPIFDSTGRVVGMTVAMMGDCTSLDSLKALGTTRVAPLNPGESKKARTEVVVPKVTVKDGPNGKVFLAWAGSPQLSGNTAYAIPSSTIKGVLAYLKANKEIERGFLGVLIAEKDGKVAITSVEPDSPAAKAGVKAGDILVSANDKIFRKGTEFSDYVASLTPGDSLRLRITRDAKPLELTATVGKRPTSQRPTPMGFDTQAVEKQMEELGKEFGKGGPNVVLSMPNTLWTAAMSGSDGLNLDDADIRQVAKSLSEVYKANVIVTDPEKITRKVSIHLNPKTITVEKAVSLICTALSCDYTKDSDAYVISPK